MLGSGFREPTGPVLQSTLGYFTDVVTSTLFAQSALRVGRGDDERVATVAPVKA